MSTNLLEHRIALCIFAQCNSTKDTWAYQFWSQCKNQLEQRRVTNETLSLNPTQPHNHNRSS